MKSLPGDRACFTVSLEALFVLFAFFHTFILRRIKNRGIFGPAGKRGFASSSTTAGDIFCRSTAIFVVTIGFFVGVVDLFQALFLLTTSAEDDKCCNQKERVPHRT
ncbi:MAG TPA: hypothetical protein DFR83_08115 [Deltaproteobacteria bacterium]|nr:hypothetical protein [Deltaproteobacteria bacterium]